MGTLLIAASQIEISEKLLVRTRLSQSVTEHNRGCADQPVFSMESLAMKGFATARPQRKLAAFTTVIVYVLTYVLLGLIDLNP